jgi:MFS transporter, DHA2 family, multidrug resistance protein
VSQPILVDTFPPAKRASAFALYTVVIVTAPAVGPGLGGWITDNYSWRWIFFINIPIGFLSFFLSSRLVRDPPAFEAERASVRINGKLHIHGIGIALIAFASAALEVALDRGQIDDWFGSSFICWTLTIGAIGWIATVVWELLTKEPTIEFRLLASRNFAIASALFYVFGFGLFGSTTLIPRSCNRFTDVAHGRGISIGGRALL